MMIAQTDRRKTPRRSMTGGGMAVFSTSLGAGILARVELHDASWTGIALTSPIAVEPGTSVSLVPDSPAWPRQTGIVVRCEPFGEAFRLGLMSKRCKAVA